MASASPRRRPLLESPSLLALLATLDVVVLLCVFFLTETPFAQLLLVHLLVFSLLTFLLFAWDKRLAKRAERRVSEWNLHLASLCGGALGALLAMSLLRHKTRHLVFRIATPILLFVHFVALAMALTA